MNPPDCLLCGFSAGIGFHLCHSRVCVIHPEVLRESRATANPLDKLTVGEMLEIHGEDPDKVVEDAERLLEESKKEYLSGYLIYRVELQSVTGLGFQGGIDSWAIETAGCTDGDLASVLDFLNSGIVTALSLRKDETYLCRLVSLNSERIRYVWKTSRLYFDGIWTITNWS